MKMSDLSDSESPIQFFSEAIDFELPEQKRIIDWIQQVIQIEGGDLVAINFIFCDDAYLHNINVEYLQHDTLTDVITFYYSEEQIEGDIFISIERTNENAEQLHVSKLYELHRVMIHGVLHLLGFGDKMPNDKKIMTQKEDAYLQLLAYNYKKTASATADTAKNLD